MVEVIGQDPGAGKRITHRNCGAIIRYFPKDLRILYSGTDYGGGPDGAEGFTCPQCGKDVIVRSW